MPGARPALRVDQVASFPNSITCTLIKHTALELPFLLFQCSFVFFRGGLGVVEKPTCGKLVRSTHRAPSHFISSERFPFETFR